MNKTHTLPWGVIAVIMAMQQVQAESTFDFANYPRPELCIKNSWLFRDKYSWFFRDETGRIFDGAGHLLPIGGEQSKLAGNDIKAILLLAPASVFTMGPGDEEARRQEAFALSGNAADSAEADHLMLMGFDWNIKKKLRLKHIVVDQESKWILNQPLINDITNTAATSSSNSKASPFRTVSVLNGALYLMGEANLDARKTIIHQTGFLGGFGVISGSVRNKGGVLAVGYKQDARINSEDNNQAVQGGNKNALEIMGSYTSDQNGRVVVYVDAQKPPTEPYLIIKQGVKGTSELIIGNINEASVQDKIIKNNGLQLILALNSPEAIADAFVLAPQNNGAYSFSLQYTHEGQHQWVLIGQPIKEGSSPVRSGATKTRLLTQSPGETSVAPTKPPRMLSDNHAYAGVAGVREDDATGSRESVNSAERSVFDIRDRRTLSEDSLALSAISDSTALSFSSEGGDAPFVPAMSDAANDARAGDDAARQSDADKGEAVPATPPAASLPEIDAWRTAASPSDDKTGAMPPFHRGKPSPVGAGNGNSFPSLTDAGNANECPSRASDDSGNLTLVNDDNAGVLCHPVSDGRDSGSISPAEGDNGGELHRLDEDAGSHLALVANTNDNLSGNVMASQAEGDNGGELHRLDEDAGSHLALVANTNDNLSGNVMASQAEGDNGGELRRLDEDAGSHLALVANTNDNLSGNLMANEAEGGMPDGLPAGPPPFAPPKVIVPAVGVYAANHALANTLFISRLSERNGAPGMTVGSLAMKADPRPTLWLRILGGETHAFVGNGSLQTRTKRQVVQGGGALLQFSRSGRDSGHVGVMFGAGKGMTVSRSTRVSSHARGGLQGYSVGLYAGWQQQPGLEGGYLDGQLSYSWFNNDVQRANVPVEYYRSAGVSATLESGYRWRLHQGERFAVFIEPLWQVSWMGVKANRLSTQSAYRDVTLTSAPWQTRLGTRLSLCAGADPSGNAPSFQPYLEINWLTTSQPFGVQTGHGRYVQDGRQQLTEIKVGHEGQLTPQIGVWGHIALQRGAGGFSDTAGSLGVKVHF